MTVLWEFHHNSYVWLEWIAEGSKRTVLKKFSIEAFEAFMSVNQKVRQVVKPTKIEEDELDFLN